MDKTKTGRRRMRGKIMRIMAVLLVIISFFCAVTDFPEEVNAADKETVKIAVLVWPGYAHSYIAQEKGFFTKYDVEVELILRDEYIEVLELYKNGDVDGLFTLLSDVVILNSEGILSKLVYVPDLTVSADGIMGKPEFNSLEDLEGRMIGFEGVNSFSHLFVLQALESAGLQEEDVYFKNILAKDVPKALEDGRIDAGHTWEPFMSKAREKGYKALAYSSGISPGVIVDVLAFNSDIVEKRPDDIKSIIKALLEAKNFIYSDKDEAIKIMAEAEGMSKEEMLSGMNGIRFPDLKENVKILKKSEDATSLYASGEVISKFYLERGQLSEIPDFDDIIEPKFINQLSRE